MENLGNKFWSSHQWLFAKVPSWFLNILKQKIKKIRFLILSLMCLIVIFMPKNIIFSFDFKFSSWNPHFKKKIWLVKNVLFESFMWHKLCPFWVDYVSWFSKCHLRVEYSFLRLICNFRVKVLFRSWYGHFRVFF